MKNTIQMQEAMKSQTYGVEIEMNSITREKAAKVAADYFGTGRHQNTARRNGYSTFSAWDDAQGREWKFSKDVSIAGPDLNKCEMVTPILTYEDMDLLQGLVRELRHHGAVSTPQQGCGVHIHVGGEGHTPQSLRSLINLMASHEDLLLHAINIDEGRTRRYCKVVDERFLEALNKQKPTTMQDFEDLWYGSQGCEYGRTQHYNSSRYHMANLHSFFHGHGTIEFRLFQFDNPDGEKKGGLHAGQLKAYINLALAMNAASKMMKGCRSQKGQRANEKYAMRTWLMRLGFIGPEFKTSMEHLTKRLEGNAAWR